MDDIVFEIEKAWHSDRIGTHWENCYLAHRDCAIRLLIEEVRKLRKILAEEECG